MSDSLLLLGRDASDYGAWTESRLPQSVALLSVGADKRSPSMRYKRTLNEDALCLVRRPGSEVLCVADAHFGDEASRYLVTAIRDQAHTWSNDFEQFRVQFFEALSKLPDAGQSETSACVCVVDTSTLTVDCLTIGDSSVVILPETVTDDFKPQIMNPQNHVYACTGENAVFRESYWQQSQFQLNARDSLLLFTDGVDECCYRQAHLSIQPGDVAELWRSKSDYEAFARELMKLSLTGVRGQPGGQDNIAILLRANY